jgi:hypothetical protein
MTVLDLKRTIRTDVDRTHLYRIGHFTDWFSLAHSLTRPAASYTLNVLPSAAVPHAVPVEACSWYALRQQSRTSKICWSAARRLALLIAADDDDRVLWKVTALDDKRCRRRRSPSTIAASSETTPTGTFRPTEKAGGCRPRHSGSPPGKQATMKAGCRISQDGQRTRAMRRVAPKSWAGNDPLFVAPLSHRSGTMRSFRSAEPAAMTEAELGNSCPGAEKPSSTSIGRDVRK